MSYINFKKIIGKSQSAPITTHIYVLCIHADINIYFITSVYTSLLWPFVHVGFNNKAPVTFLILNKIIFLNVEMNKEVNRCVSPKTPCSVFE